MAENKENIKSVTEITREAANEMSPEEFQRTLRAWFEDQGIISDLRSHLRHQMIEILRNTTLGMSIKQKHTTLTPKAQAITLLIAEYLLRHKYSFSLSIFTAEVPFLKILPEYIPCISNNAQRAGTSNENLPPDDKFSNENFWEILENLGFARDSIYSRLLFDYYQNKSESLLNCMIRLLSNICNVKNMKNSFKFDSNGLFTADILNSNIEPWLKDIYYLLKHFEVPDEIILHLHEHLKSLFDKEQVRIKTEESTKFNILQAEIQSEFQSREAEICRTINEMENTFYKEKQKLTNELTHEQEKIIQIKKALQKRQDELDDRYDAISRKEEMLKIRENEILEQTEILKSRIKNMQNLYDALGEQKLLKNDETGPKTNLEYEFLRKEIQETRETIQKFNQSKSREAMAEIQSESEEKLLKGILERIQAENGQLRAINNQQQMRLDELSMRNSILMTDLENSQATINILTRSRQSNAITVPPLTAPPPHNITNITHHRTRSGLSNYLSGGGETLAFTAQPPSSPPLYRNLLQSSQSRDNRRKIARRLIIHGNESTEESPTDEILQEARQRLRKLEEETEAVDRSYRAFKQKHSKTTTDGASEVWYQSRNRNYVSIPEHLKTMFLPRNSTDLFTNQSNNYRRNFIFTRDLSFPSTSQHQSQIKDDNVPSTSRQNVDYTLREDYHRSTTPPSATSSENLPNQLGNLSISSVNISSDNTERNDDKNPENNLK